MKHIGICAQFEGRRCAPDVSEGVGLGALHPEIADVVDGTDRSVAYALACLQMRSCAAVDFFVCPTIRHIAGIPATVSDSCLHIGEVATGA